MAAFHRWPYKNKKIQSWTGLFSFWCGDVDSQEAEIRIPWGWRAVTEWISLKLMWELQVQFWGEVRGNNRNPKHVSWAQFSSVWSKWTWCHLQKRMHFAHASGMQHHHTNGRTSLALQRTYFDWAINRSRKSHSKATRFLCLFLWQYRVLDYRALRLGTFRLLETSHVACGDLLCLRSTIPPAVWGTSNFGASTFKSILCHSNFFFLVVLWNNFFQNVFLH